MVLTFGEMMLRLSTVRHERFSQATQLDACYGGSEANVAMALGAFGEKAAFLTKLPKNALGDKCIKTLQQADVDTAKIIRGGNRLGTYYLETGAGVRSSKVIYDRAGSAFAESAAEEYDWKELLQGVSEFHVSGITPALSDALAAITIEACREAQKRGITVSCDLNMRKNLWSDKKARQVLTTVFENVDVLIANESQAASLFHLNTPDEDAPDYSKTVAHILMERFPAKLVALTRRRTVSASETIFSGTLYDGKTFVSSSVYRLPIVDRVGSGDAFSAGVIYGLIHKMPLRETVDFAAAAAALKHSIPGDVLYATASEVKTVATGFAGNIQR